MRPNLFLLFTILISFLIHPTVNLVAYDQRNEFLDIPHNEIHVITDAIDSYHPKLHVQFINFQNVKRRRGSQTRDGQIRIEPNAKPKSKKQQQTIKTVEAVKTDKDKIDLRFGGGSRNHFPYNRVISYSNQRKYENLEQITISTTMVPIDLMVTPEKWATPTTTIPSYSAEPALYLPSRFHKVRENVVIVYKRKPK